MGWKSLLGVVAALSLAAPNSASAWGGKGHRIVAAVAAGALPSAKVQQMDQVLQQLERNRSFVDAAAYPDEYVRGHDPEGDFDPWHYANLPDDGGNFYCQVQSKTCLFDALEKNLAILREGRHDYKQAVALAWVMHLVGDLHQPLHMSGRYRGGTQFAVRYRGRSSCFGFPNVQLHKVWDNCLVEEATVGKTPEQAASDLLGGTSTYVGASGLDATGQAPWRNSWASDAHALANARGFGNLHSGANLRTYYITGPNKALETATSQMRLAGLRLAWLLDRNFN